MIGPVLLILLILMVVGAFPSWPHSKNWGYYPSGGLGLLVVLGHPACVWQNLRGWMTLFLQKGEDSKSTEFYTGFYGERPSSVPRPESDGVQEITDRAIAHNARKGAQRD